MALALRLPKWREIEKYFKDPDIVTTEILFLFLSVSNVFVMFKLLTSVVPYPVFVTWWQLTQGLVMATTLGLLGQEYQKFAYFPKVDYDFSLIKSLILYTFVYAGMVVLGNEILSKINCIANFPVVLSFTVVLHHVTRFLGCGEEYMPMRWHSVLIMFLAFVLGCSDGKTVTHVVLPFALLHAAFSAIFRACYLQKVLHVVDGRSNMLHNNLHITAVFLLPIMIIAVGEWKVFFSMPTNFLELHTWQMWGCLVTASLLPFLKNIVSNRLIRTTGQFPWRVLEIISVILVVFIGNKFTPVPSWTSWAAFLMVLFGRIVGMYDVMVNMTDKQSSSSYSDTQTTGPDRIKSRNSDMYNAASSGDGYGKPFLSSVEEDQLDSARSMDRSNDGVEMSSMDGV